MSNTNDLAGLILLNNANATEAEISNILNLSPVLRQMYAQPASQGGTQHVFNRMLTAPGAGFRLVNEGITNSNGTFEQVTVSCALLDASFSRDKAIAMGYRKGATAYMDKEAMQSMAQAFFQAESAIFQATINKQFTGLPGNAYFDAITVDSQVVDAGGAGGKSVWLLRTAENGISVVAGNDGNIVMDTEDSTIEKLDGSSRPYTALHRSIMGWFGLQVGSQYDAARIANLDGTTNHTLTDALIMQAYSKFKAGMPPNLIAMNRTALQELWASRTAVNPTGKEADMPIAWQGIPIIVTDALPSNEAALNTTTTTTTTSTQA
jgi:hypothetical protein